MAIDSIGGGGDSSYETRRRQLEQDRARDLEKIEARNKQEREKTEELRERELRRIYEDQAESIGEKQQNADRRIEEVKAAADARVRQFQDEAARMTDEAKRQFQSKANLLAKNSDELEKQRQYMLKQHNDSMQRLKEDREKATNEQHQRMSREAQQTYFNGRRKLEELNEHGEEEVARLRSDIAERKRKEANDGARELYQLQDERDHNSNSVRSQIDFNRREGEQQMGRLQHELRLAEMDKRQKFDNDEATFTREARSAINRARESGKKNLKETSDFYTEQIETTKKQDRKQIADLQNKHHVMMQTIDSDANVQEHLAAQGFAAKKKLNEENREKILKQQTFGTQALREKAETNYQAMSKALETQKNQLLLKQHDAAARDLKFQAELQKKQVNEAVAHSAKAVSDHDASGKDPFYRVHALAARIAEADNHYLVEVHVPEHEQDTVRLTLQQGHLSLSGTRRFGDKFDTPDGRNVATNSYQSYSESFPVKGKLEMNRMQRDYSNGKLTFKIPKG